MDIQMTPIGYIRSHYREKKDIPRQSIYSETKTAKLEILEEYTEGARDIHAGDYGVIFFYFHKSEGYTLRQVSGKTGEEKGLFSLRSPNRPNGIGMTIVKYLDVQGSIIEFEGVDMLDGTPVLDIKPYVEELNPKL